VVNEAREFNIRLIMVLTDSQGDYGGMAQYVRWAGPITETVRDFYASKRIRVSLGFRACTLVRQRLLN
jgi:endo-1,4-beta-mannosidase